MLQLVIMTGWTVLAGFIGYSIAQAKTTTEVKRLRRDVYYLRRWCDQLQQEVTSLDLDLELERLRK